jgi:carboxyl-terminal processing protease
MNRERLAWTISLMLILTLAFHLPGTLAERDDDYEFVRTLVDIHRLIDANYVEPVDDTALHEKAIDGMLSDLDPFSVYIPPDQQEDFDRMLDNSFRGVGIQLMVQDGKATVETPIDGSPAYEAGVLAGDVILKVNGQIIEGMELADVVKLISGPVGTQVTLTVQHDSGQVADLTMTRREIVVNTVDGYQRRPDATWDYYCAEKPKIAYVRITQFTENTFDDLSAALLGTPASGNKPATPGIMNTGMKGLILDLRFNPGGRLDQAIKVVNMFVKDGVIVSTKGRNRPEDIVRADGKATLTNFPMIVMVNEHSASAAEIVSGSLKDNHRALVLGTRSYGKGSVQELIPLEDNGGELKLTVAYYYLPSGRLVHRKKGATDWGVEPQIVVPMDEDTERSVIEEREEREAIRGPATRPAVATSEPTTAPTDIQLQTAINTMVGDLVLHPQ